MAKEIWVFAEQRDKELPGGVFEALGIARTLADSLSTKVTAVLLGDGIRELTGQLKGVDKVYLVEDKTLDSFNSERFSKVLAGLAQKENPLLFIFPGTANGKSLAPRVAAATGGGMVSDCNDIALTDGKLEFTHSILAGKGLAKANLDESVTGFVTIRPKAFERTEGNTGEVIEITPEASWLESKLKVKEFIAELSEKVSLEEADIIVAGGRGTGGNFGPLEELAEVLGGAVGASRAAVDAGWISYAHQVGQTGKTVSPKVYIACGISGALQHLAGMQSADVIIAINKNPDAPIFQMAHYGIVGDMFEIIPEIIAEVKKA